MLRVNPVLFKNVSFDDDSLKAIAFDAPVVTTSVTTSGASLPQENDAAKAPSQEDSSSLSPTSSESSIQGGITKDHEAVPTISTTSLQGAKATASDNSSSILDNGNLATCGLATKQTNERNVNPLVALG